jgi:protocatechuate 3,4-dioxygenase beta subunit
MFTFSKKSFYSIMFLVIATVLLCANISTSQGIIYVPSQYTTIQSAINASSNGDTVVIADGIYTGSGNTNIDFLGKAITVKSENGPNNCIIDCENIENKMGFYLHSGETNNSVIEGFTIQNGKRSYNPNHAGGGIYCTGSSPTIRNNIIKNNYAVYGGGILCYLSNAIIIGNTIIQNSASDGGGICISVSTATIVNNLIVSNSASWGSGICVESQSLPKIINNTIVKNTGSSGVLCSNSIGSPVITNCIIFDNNSGSIANPSGTAPTVTYSDIQGGYSGVGNINADPIFVNFANNDYHLQDTSPCIGAGTANGAPTIDILGNPRPSPIGSNPDMGAYENGQITPINYPPVANDDSAATTKNVAVTINVLANDTDANNDILVIDSITQPLHGIANIVSSSINYIPESNFEGSDNFTYTVSDGNGGFDSAQVSIYIKPYYYCDDFEDGNVSDWVGGYYTGEVDLDYKNAGSPFIGVSTSAAKSGNYGLIFTKDQSNGTSATASSPEFGPIMEPFQASFDVILLDNLNHLIWFGETAPFETHNERDNQKFGVSFSLGTISLRTPTFPIIGEYYPNEFYHVTIAANPLTNLYNITIAGNLLDLNNNPVNILSANNVPFEFPVHLGGIRKINLYTGSTTIPNSMGIDNILMGPVQIIPPNNPPIAEAGGPYTGNEGSLIIFNGSSSSDPDNDSLQYRWDFNNDGTWDTDWSDSPTATHTCYDSWSGNAKLEVKDSEFTVSDLANVTVTPASGITIKLRDSNGNLITNSGATILYQPNSSGSYINFGDGILGPNGSKTENISLGTHRFRLTYQGCTQEKQQNVSTNPTVVYQTKLVTVELKNSGSAPILNSNATITWQAGSAGSYVNFGDGTINTDDGKESMEVLPLTHRFRLTYQACTQEKQQNVSTNSTVLYQTQNVTVELKNSTSNYITDSGATITWQAGSAGSYVIFGDGAVNADGKESMEVLPLTHRFRLTYKACTQEKQQNVSTNPTVLYQTQNVTVELKNSTNNYIIDSGATITWQAGSAGSYVIFGDGTVNADGKESMEVLPLTHRFRLTYQACTQEKQQNVSTNSTVLYQTQNVTVELKDSNGNLVENTGAIVVWQAGSAGSYVIFGDGILNSNGQENMEVLPLTHRFRMTYNGGTQEKQSSSTTVTYSLASFPAMAPQWCLLENFPNPFNPETWIPYSLKDGVEVTVRIHDVSGRLVKTISLGYKSPGLYTSRDKAAYWDGRNEAGEQVSSGIYFYNIQAGNFSATKKMIVKK